MGDWWWWLGLEERRGGGEGMGGRVSMTEVGNEAKSEGGKKEGGGGGGEEKKKKKKKRKKERSKWAKWTDRFLDYQQQRNFNVLQLSKIIHPSTA